MLSTLFLLIVALFRAILPGFLHPNKRKEPKKLQSLPPEILSQVIRHLPHSGAISLSYTSRGFYQLVSVRIEHLFERFPFASESTDRLNDQKTYKQITAGRPYNVLHQLSREYVFDRYCVFCRTRHKLAEYSTTARRQPVRERKCLKVEGILWLCPSMAFSLTETLELRCDYELNRPGCQDRINGLCACGQHYTKIIDETIIQIFPIAAFQGARPDSSDMTKISSALRTLQVRICPHTSISDERMIRALRGSSNCSRVFDFDPHRRNCSCCYDRNYDCSKCKTTIQFRYHHSPQMRESLVYLVIGKPVDKQILAVFGHAKWKSLVTLPSEVATRKEEWERCFRHFREQHPIEGRSVPALEWNPWF